MQVVKLREYKTTPGVELTPDQRDLIRAAVPDLTVQPTPGESDRYDLTPGGKVGVVRVDDVVLELRPKIDVGRLMFLVSYAVDPRGWRPDPVGLAPDDGVLEAVVPTFVHHVQRAFRRGVIQGYLTTDDSLTTVRGRIRIDEQINRRFGIAPPVEVRYDDYTDDVVENRLVKAAIHKVRLVGLRNPVLRTALRRLDAELVNVSLVQFDPRRVPEVHFTRLNERYRAAIGLARLLLQSSSLELAAGDSHGTAVLLDMPRVFEDFVHAALREQLGLDASRFPQGNMLPSLHLDAAKRVRLRPDLSWWEGNDCVFVGDVKYKRTDDAVNHPDLYQLLSYVTATDLPGGLLVYADGEAEPTTHLAGSPPRALRVRTLPIDGPPQTVMSGVQAIADEVRDLCELARPGRESRSRTRLALTDAQT